MKNGKLNIIIFLFAFSLNGFIVQSQERVDSLLNVFQGASDSIKNVVLDELVDEYLPVSLEKSLEYAIQSLEIANYNNNQVWISDAYTRIGQVYF